MCPFSLNVLLHLFHWFPTSPKRSSKSSLKFVAFPWLFIWYTKDVKTHFSHNATTRMIWKSHPSVLTIEPWEKWTHIPAYALVEKLNTLTDISPWGWNVLFSLSKDKVKLCSESHHSPQIRSQKSVHTQTLYRQTHTHKSKDTFTYPRKFT